VTHSGGGGHMPRPASKGEDYKFIAYPNPTKDLLKVDALDWSKSELVKTQVSGQLYDLHGNSLSSIKFTNTRATVNMDRLKKGICSLQVYDKKTVESHKIVVE